MNERTNEWMNEWMNNIHANITITTTARAFLVHSTDRLKQITTFVKLKHFKTNRFQNHSVKNVEMCKDWFYTSQLKITRFTIISKNKVNAFRIILYYESSARNKLLFWTPGKTLRTAKDERQHLLSCLMSVRLFLRATGLVGLMEKFLRFKRLSQ